MRMEVRRNPCVLPSNAPALESKADCPIGVLRTSSGNVLSSSLDSRRRPFKATSAHHTGVRASRAFDDAQSRFGSSARQSAQRQRQKKVPDDVFPILNGEELQSPKYLVYRERQRREEGTDGKQVWSDELEVAFQTALRRVAKSGPFGRKKRPFVEGGTPKGKNEWISHYIEILTGQQRDRKQVSSHLQVLKCFMSNNQDWMKLVVKGEDSDRGSNPDVTDSWNERCLATDGDLKNNPDDMRKTYSSYPNTLSADDTLEHYSPSGARSIHRIEFEMYIISPDLGNQPRRILHSYTSIQSEIGSVAKALDDMEDWRTMYPQLSSTEEDGHLNSEVILLDAGFDLLTDHPPRRSKLGVHFFVNIARGVDYRNWGHTTRFYNQASREQGSPVHSSWKHEARSSQVAHTDSVRVEMSLDSEWLVDQFVILIERRRAAAAEGHSSALDREEEYACRYLREMSVMQEIWATPQGAEASPQRMAILLWRFRKTESGTAATTTWRKLTLPPLPQHMLNTPISTLPQPPLTFETTLSDPQAQGIYQTHYFPPHQNLWAPEDPENFIPTPLTQSSSPSPLPYTYSPSINLPTSTTLPPPLRHQDQDQTYTPHQEDPPIYHHPIPQAYHAHPTSLPDFPTTHIHLAYDYLNHHHDEPPLYDDIPSFTTPPPPPTNPSSLLPPPSSEEEEAHFQSQSSSHELVQQQQGVFDSSTREWEAGFQEYLRCQQQGFEEVVGGLRDGGVGMGLAQDGGVGLVLGEVGGEGEGGLGMGF
ncbi:hypothetical protein MMC12_001342 [Toensbergia leucococca]|nr:hypothetical protein [Toensbergia leucococca]